MRQIAANYKALAQESLARRAGLDAAAERERAAERHREGLAFQRALGTFKSTLEQGLRDNGGSRSSSHAGGTSSYRSSSSSSTTTAAQRLSADTRRDEQAARDRLGSRSTVTLTASTTAPTRTASTAQMSAPRTAATPTSPARTERAPADHRPKLTAVPEAIMVCTRPSGPNGSFECRSPVTTDQGHAKESRSTHQTP